MTVQATLGGATLLGSSPVTWSLREGTQPVVQTFDLIPADAARLVTQGGPVTLTIKPDVGSPLVVKNLWVLSEAAGENEHVARVAVADRRWFWPYAWVYRRYNMRRRTGVKRVAVHANVPEIANISDTICFHPWSLREGQPGQANRWEALDALKDVMTDILAADTAQMPVPVYGLPANLRSLPLEDVVIDDAGDAALSRMLAYMPEARVWIDYSGAVRFDSRTSGAEVGMAAALGPEAVGGGHITMAHYSRQRPKKINVLFTREMELRFDFNEPATAVGSAPVTTEVREVENVLPVPDYSLTISNVTYPEGSWVTFPQAMNAWGNLTEAFGQLDYDVLCQAFVPGMDLWGVLQYLSALATDADWGHRIAACQQHFRQTFRINQRWLSRIAQLKAYRVATLDPTNGVRSPAVAYSDYCVIGTQRLWLRNAQTGAAYEYARNYTGYPADGVIGSDTRPAPARVSIVDDDQGIIRVDYLMDDLRLSDIVLPSKIVEASRPTARIDRAGRDYSPLTFDSVIEGTESERLPRLTSSHKIAFILTAVPGAPNNNTSLQKVEIRPSDLVDIIGDVGPCTGPEWTIRVGAGIETARFHWIDGYSAAIERAFGFNNDRAAAQAADDSKTLEALCVNLEADAEGAASCRAIARAVAARVYASLKDHAIGQATGHLAPHVELAGWLTDIAHEVGQDGATMTRITMPEKLQKFNLLAYLDANTRKIVLREVR